MKVKIYAHKDYLILDGNDEASENYMVPGGNQIGTLLLECTPETLGISAIAAEILSKVRRSNDDIGEIDVFKTDNNKAVIGWLGATKRLAHISAEGSNSYDFGALDGKYTVIPNTDAPQDAIAAIDDFEKTIEDEVEVKTPSRVEGSAGVN